MVVRHRGSRCPYVVCRYFPGQLSYEKWLGSLQDIHILSVIDSLGSYRKCQNRQHHRHDSRLVDNLYDFSKFPTCVLGSILYAMVDESNITWPLYTHYVGPDEDGNET